MLLERIGRSARPEIGLSNALYIELVDTLLVEIRGLALTLAATILGAVAVGLTTRDSILWLFAAALVVLGAVRMYYMQAHSRNRPSPNLAAARAREFNYIIGATVFITLLGIWTMTVFWRTEDGFSRFLSTLTTTSCIFGIWTRSLAINKNGTNAQLLAGFATLSGAFWMGGGLYPLLIVTVLVPLFGFIKISSTKLRETLLGEIVARREAATLATRLDRALNNMSHGLCMVDGEGRLTVANEQVLRIFSLRPEDAKVGADMRGVLRLLVRNDVVARGEIERLSQALFRVGEESDFVVPLETIDKRAIEITVHRMKDEGTVVVIQDVTERRNAERAIDRMARFDSVTDLPNRRCFEEQLTITLKACRQAQDKVAVLFLDLDDFKQVNDSLGHTRGDKLLAAIAERLQTLVRPTDLVARWGGDEFAILQRPVTDEQQTGLLAEQIIREVSRPVFVDGYEVIVGVSVGSACAPQTA
jgi:diguanylate cyclase (GGDEF)-like protein